MASLFVRCARRSPVIGNILFKNLTSDLTRHSPVSSAYNFSSISSPKRSHQGPLCCNFYPNTRILMVQPPLNQLTRTEVRFRRSGLEGRDWLSGRKFSDKPAAKEDDDEPKGVVQKFKYLWKKYWYLVLPVHLVTSCAWFGGFYLLAASGADVVGWIEWLNFVPDSWMDKLHKTPSAANVAVAYLCYKIATPARYAVTVGGTTLLIRMGEQGKRDIPSASEVGDNIREIAKDGRKRMRVHRRQMKELRGRFNMKHMRERYHKFRRRLGRSNGKKKHH